MSTSENCSFPRSLRQAQDRLFVRSKIKGILPYMPLYFHPASTSKKISNPPKGGLIFHHWRRDRSYSDFDTPKLPARQLIRGTRLAAAVMFQRHTYIFTIFCRHFQGFKFIEVFFARAPCVRSSPGLRAPGARQAAVFLNPALRVRFPVEG